MQILEVDRHNIICSDPAETILLSPRLVALAHLCAVVGIH